MLNGWERRIKNELNNEIDCERKLLQDIYSNHRQIGFNHIEKIEKKLDKALEAKEYTENSGHVRTGWNGVIVIQSGFTRKLLLVANEILFMVSMTVLKYGRLSLRTWSRFLWIIFLNFSSPHPPRILSYWWGHTSYPNIGLTRNEWSSIALPFTEEEVQQALFQMFPTKAPRHDGFHALFYQFYWEIVKDKTAAWCLGVLNEKAFVRSLNTLILPWSKKKVPKGSIRL